ncbi:MAG: N-acetyltransferase [Candidatus Dadabacteria bacterium]|nr:MAG: N-acetyltransferase [Candidatus Dadabacteria bacterium]
MDVKIYDNVSLGENPSIGEWVILGYPPRGKALPLSIGDNCVIRSHTVIYAGNTIGDGFQTGHHVMIRENNTIGDFVSVGTGSVIEHHVKIGDKVRIHSQAFVPEFSVLEKGVWIGPNVVVTNAKYPNAPDTKNNLEGVYLEEGCKIGANATLLPGIRVGRFALIGAGSVVTKDVPDWAVVRGVPAKVVGRVDEIESYKKAL